jgi:hypothetical protein
LIFLSAATGGVLLAGKQALPRSTLMGTENQA